MRKIILTFLLAMASVSSALCEKQPLPLDIHQSGASKDLTEEDRNPINLPIAVFYDSDTNILEVWCDDDNIQAEIYIYDENGDLQAHSPYMNVSIPVSSGGSHSVILIGDGWEAEGEF